MIVYQCTKESFQNDILNNRIEKIILSNFQHNLEITTSKSEIDSWKNSMQYMNTVLSDPEIPQDSGITIEFQIPQTSKRIDFILTGMDANKIEHAVIIELKQWTEAQATDKDAIVITRFKHGLKETSHPSYQAWSYAALLHGFYETVYTDNIQLQPCAYLHNYENDGIINDKRYADYIEKAPLFLSEDALKLRMFIKQFVKYGDQTKIMFRIDSGKIKPSKSLADSMVKMLKGNQEFIMIDDQKVVYETALALAKQSSEKNKNVLIVEGGPGTGKSVVAVQLLVNITKHGLLTQYITKNAAPRAVYESKLKGDFKKTVISNLFTGSGSYINCPENQFDALIVDEAHRLNEKSGMFKNLGENQIKEIIKSSKFSIFFIDKDQKVTFNDIGEKEEIIKFANYEGATIHELKLASQFRCNGSDGYLAWLDNSLQINDTANTFLHTNDYDFRVISSPSELKELIIEKNKINNKARMVAGYCWDWTSKNDPKAYDIIFPEYDFSMRWNLATDGSLWILGKDSVNEIGCIHTCQGLEVDYIGVIVGKDLFVRNGKIMTDVSKRSKNDSSVKGYKKQLAVNREAAIDQIDKIIKNTYRTLMTRGMKGCYVYFEDKETEEYFKERIVSTAVKPLLGYNNGFGETFLAADDGE